MKTSFIICAAGVGARFATLLPNVPKPLILLNDKTLLEWALASLPILPTDDVIIITQAKDKVRAKLAEKLNQLYPFNEIQWLELDHQTRGQLETVWQARDLLDLAKSITIYNSDSYFESTDLSAQLRLGTAAGLIPCSQEPGNAWSFCQIGRDDQVLAVAEKTRISDWASVGLYFFRDPKLFLAQTELELAGAPVTEFYVAPLYQRYLQLSQLIKIIRLPVFKPMGTPEQVESYWGISPQDLVNQNR